MIRVVIDTNVVVSVLLRSGGIPEAIFNLAIDGDIQWFVSEAILAEYEDVLRRPRLAIDSAKTDDALRRIRSVALLVRPTGPVIAASDPDDNVFLECAQTANAAYLVTGNIRHFPEPWMTTQIVTIYRLLDRVSGRSSASHHPASTRGGEPGACSELLAFHYADSEVIVQRGNTSDEEACRAGDVFPLAGSLFASDGEEHERVKKFG